MSMSIHELSPELLALVLGALETPCDLYAAILASPLFFRAFSISPTFILASVFQNAIHPEALRHAVAVVRARSISASLQQSKDLFVAAARRFLDGYFVCDWTGFNLPLGRDEIVDLARVYARTTRFIDGFCARAATSLQLPPSAGSLSDHSSDPLLPTWTERARLQRAFFRWELYDRCFPAKPRHWRDCIVSPEEQFDLFISRLQPWEAEEMSCAHRYLTLVLGTHLDALDDELVQAVVSCPGAKKFEPGPDQVAYSLESAPKISQSTPIPVDASFVPPPSDRMVFFDNLEFSGLGIFSDYFPMSNPPSGHISPEGSLTSRGLEFIDTLLRADPGRRRTMLCQNSTGRCDFFPEALDHAVKLDLGPRTLIPTPPNSSRDEENPHYENAGYTMFQREPNDGYLPINYGGNEMSLLRERGYVFWDKARISEPAVRERLVEAQRMHWKEARRLFDRKQRRRGKTPEDRLVGYMLPMSQRERLIREFGPA